jgi:tetratricopeptide (TPR) repeat protein
VLIQTYLESGKAYDAQNRPGEAYNAFAKAIELDPKAEQAYVALADFASAHGNRAFAREAIERGKKNCPASANLAVEAGILWAFEGDFDKAAKNFSMARQLAPEWNVPLLALGVTQLQEGRVAESASTFQTATTLDSNDYRAPYLYATALTHLGDQNDPAKRGEIISALSKAVALNPKLAKLRVTLAQAYLSGNRNEAAASELRAAVSLDPNEPTALYQLSLVLRRQGKIEEATRLMQRFRAVKEKTRQNENELVQILKTVR